MNTVHLRFLTYVVLTVSLSITRVNAQYSVCCPVPELETSLPVNQCNDYLELAAEGEQASTDDWIERVSDSLEKSNSQQVVMPVKAKPSAASRIEFDLFYPAKTERKAAAASVNVDKETDSEIVFDLCDEVRAIEERAAEEQTEKGNANNTDHREIIIIRQDITPGTQSSGSATPDSDKREIAASSTGERSQSAYLSRKRIDAHLAYDLYLAEANFLYGTLGYQAIYGTPASSANATIANNTPTGRPANKSKSLELDPLVEAARFDGYLPYDLPCMIGNNHVAEPEIVTTKTAVPERNELPVTVSTRIEIAEIVLIPKLVFHHLEQISRTTILALQTKSVDWNNEIEAALCGTAALDFWRDAICAHQRSIEIKKRDHFYRFDSAHFSQMLSKVAQFKMQLEDNARQLLNQTASETTKLIGWRVKNKK